ncbi:MAG: hydrogenase nickel incorporation protein HypB [Betaproteobacteria bacterium]|nr:hydrogenase nickel incorporation protein HypB [Betaproteobacteria bacterium]
MCIACGCGLPETGAETGTLDYGANPAGSSVTGMNAERIVRIEEDVLAANARHAEQNRAHFTAHGVLALNLVSSPGSGKTTLLVATLRRLRERMPELALAVIEGDQQTATDAERIRAAGVPAIQINTGKGCHLDARMVGEAFARLPMYGHEHEHEHEHGHGHEHEHEHGHEHHPPHSSAQGGLLMIENVGNLVCPALWDLGEAAKIVMLSVTEGEDKALKYPDMFAAARLMLLTKTDLLPHLDFDVETCVANALRINPELEVLQLSARNGNGMDAWLDWLAAALARQREGEEEIATLAALQRRITALEEELAALKQDTQRIPQE